MNSAHLKIETIKDQHHTGKITKSLTEFSSARLSPLSQSATKVIRGCSCGLLICNLLPGLRFVICLHADCIDILEGNDSKMEAVSIEPPLYLINLTYTFICITIVCEEIGRASC